MHFLVSITGLYYSSCLIKHLPSFRTTCKEALRNYNSLDNPAVDVSEEHLNELDDVFRKAAKADTPTEV
jgi:STIP1 family protein 1